MKKIIFFLIPLLIVAVIVVGYFKLTQKISTIKLPSLPSVSISDLVKYSRFSLYKAPSESLVGSISTMSGEIDYEPRTATVSAKINSPVPVQQGESLATGVDGKLVLTFDKNAEIDFLPETSVDIIQTLPADLVFAQKTGTAEYKKLADIPVTIRVMHLLAENGGDIVISIDKIRPIVTLTVKSGSAEFAYNNINNDTKLVTVPAGKKLTFNDSTRRVVVR